MKEERTPQSFEALREEGSSALEWRRFILRSSLLRRTDPSPSIKMGARTPQSFEALREEGSSTVRDWPKRKQEAKEFLVPG
jgi:hypothetical protein